MQDPLNAIRRLYDEPGAEAQPDRLSSEDRAEMHHLAALKAGLDALPPQRPEASTLDAVFAAVEADRFAPLRAVYEGEDVAAEALEVAAVTELKAGLDALPPQRPEATTLDAVFAAAAAGQAADAAKPARAGDRAPQRLVTRRRVVVALSAAFALMLVLTSGLWLGRPADVDSIAAAEPEVAQMEDSQGAEAAPAERIGGETAQEPTTEALTDAPIAAAVPTPAGPNSPARTSAREAVARPQAARAQPADAPRVASAERRAVAPAEADFADAVAVPEVAAPSEADLASSFAAGNLAGQGLGELTLASDESLPLADGDKALQTLYLRMRDMQNAQAGLGWDEPPVALGAPPDSVPTTTGWMQVRVER